MAEPAHTPFWVLAAGLRRAPSEDCGRADHGSRCSLRSHHARQQLLLDPHSGCHCLAVHSGMPLAACSYHCGGAQSGVGWCGGRHTARVPRDTTAQICLPYQGLNRRWPTSGIMQCCTCAQWVGGRGCDWTAFLARIWCHRRRRRLCGQGGRGDRRAAKYGPCIQIVAQFSCVCCVVTRVERARWCSTPAALLLYPHHPH